MHFHDNLCHIRCEQKKRAQPGSSDFFFQNLCYNCKFYPRKDLFWERCSALLKVADLKKIELNVGHGMSYVNGDSK